MKRQKSGIIVILASLVVIITGLKLAASIIAPFLFAIFISILGMFPLFWLYKKGVKKGIAIIIIITGMILSGMVFTVIVGSSISQFISSVPKYESLLRNNIALLTKYLRDLGFDVSKATILTYIDPESVFKTTGRVIGQLGNLLTNLFLITFISIFVLLEASSLPEKLKFIFKDSDLSMGNIKQIGESIKNYILIKTYISFLTGFIVGISLYLLGVDFAILWGVIAFLLNYVPNIGSIIAAFPASLMALVQYGISRFLIVVIIYFAVNMIVGNIIEPKYLGKELGLSPLVVFLSLIFWGWVLGIVGMFLSVPLTMIVKIIFSNSKDKKWIAVLLSDKAE
jgi:predicted PurR-regulated permease PerM